MINLNFGDVFRHLGEFLSKNWQAIGLVIVVCLFFLTKNDYAALKNSMDVMSMSYQEQISTLEALHAKEIAAREEAIAIYERELIELTRKYDEDIENLQRNKEEDIEEYIRDFTLQPEKLAREIEEQFGFEYVE
ncbi:MAG: hypothetical protein H8E74_02235 [Gammaproteobacteria bacterium]|nr:hypothetical protein [Gammaproteobacteria bacterium]